jgi:hypothetical protein
MKKSNAFARHQFHFKLVAIACFATGGWLLIQDVELSRIGLVEGDGWPLMAANPAVWAMAAFMAGIAILATQPQYWDDLFLALMDFGDNGHQVPRWLRFTLAALMLCLFLAVGYFVYRFNFTTTHVGLFPGQPITQDSMIKVLFINFGPECLAFIGGQVLRLGAIANKNQLAERLQVEPANRYQQRLLANLNDAADSAAEAHTSKAWAKFYRDNPDMAPNQGWRA